MADCWNLDLEQQSWDDHQGHQRRRLWRHRQELPEIWQKNTQEMQKNITSIFKIGGNFWSFGSITVLFKQNAVNPISKAGIVTRKRRSSS